MIESSPSTIDILFMVAIWGTTTCNQIAVCRAKMVQNSSIISGVASILKEFESHQTVVACMPIRLVTGNLEVGIILGGSVQMIALR